MSEREGAHLKTLETCLLSPTDVCSDYVHGCTDTALRQAVVVFTLV